MKKQQKIKTIIPITPHMIKVGVQVLNESGALWLESPAHAVLVQELLQKCLECHLTDERNSSIIR